MNKKIIITAVLAAYLGAMGAASAQDRGNHYGNDKNRGDQRDDRRGDRHDDNDRGERRNDRNDYHPVDNRDHDRGAGPRHDMRKGGRLPPEYRNRQYVVNDWRGHHLSAPPRGYQWVQTGSDYVLVGIATGIIASLLLNN
jgi:Ni/Co efflux regulator RcnB